MYDVLVIGAGQAGLAAGYYLQQSWLTFLIVDAASSMGNLGVNGTIPYIFLPHECMMGYRECLLVEMKIACQAKMKLQIILKTMLNKWSFQ